MVNAFLHTVRSGSAATTRLRSRDLNRTITSRVQTSMSARYPVCWKNSRPFDKRVCNCSRTLRKRNGKDAERRMDRKSRHCHWRISSQATNCIMWMSCGRDISAAERQFQMVCERPPAAFGGSPPHGGENKANLSLVRGRRERSERGG